MKAVSKPPILSLPWYKFSTSKSILFLLCSFDINPVIQVFTQQLLSTCCVSLLGKAESTVINRIPSFPSRSVPTRDSLSAVISSSSPFHCPPPPFLNPLVTLLLWHPLSTTGTNGRHYVFCFSTLLDLNSVKEGNRLAADSDLVLLPDSALGS